MSGKSGCEKEPALNDCLKTLLVHSLPKAWKKCGYAGRPFDKAIGFQDLIEEIRLCRPVQAYLSKEAHYVMLIGWQHDPTNQPMVEVADPMGPVPGLVSLQKLLSSKGWSSTFLEIAP